MAVRGKFVVGTITKNRWFPNAGTVVLDAVHDDGIEENKRYFDATPSGKIEMLINNPAALNQFQLGQEFYVDFSPVVVADDSKD